MTATVLVLVAVGLVVATDVMARTRNPPPKRMTATDWKRLARRWGFTARLERSGPRLVGVLEDTALQITLCAEGERIAFHVQAALRARVSGAFRVCSGSDGAPLPSPILNGRVAVEGDAQDRALLHEPALVGPLLAVLLRWPGAYVDATGVHITGETHRLRQDLDQAIHDAAALAAALRLARGAAVRSVYTEDD